MCMVCGQIYCSHCSRGYECPNCGESNSRHMDISKVIILKEKGKIVGGRNKEFLDDRQRREERTEKNRREVAEFNSNQNQGKSFIRSNIDSSGTLNIPDISQFFCR